MLHYMTMNFVEALISREVFEPSKIAFEFFFFLIESRTIDIIRSSHHDQDTMNADLIGYKLFDKIN